MRVLVSGGAGFIGSALVRALAERGDPVIVVDGAFARELPASVEQLHIDVADPTAMLGVFDRCHPEAVVHLAAILTDGCAEDIVKGTSVNCLGTAVMLAACQRVGVARLLITTSVAALGEPGRESVYGLTKRYAEHLARLWELEHPETRVSMARLGWVYGPGRVRGWRDLQAVIEAFARGDAEIHYPNFPDPLDWTYISDAVEGLLAVLDRAPDHAPVVDIGGDLRYVRDAIQHLEGRYPEAKAIGHKAVPPPAAWRLDRSYLEGQLGCGPAIRLEDGLDLTTAALTQGAAFFGAVHDARGPGE
ncbi:MAG: NAD-dependent epimerase/dehydratase family protein [Candidatus Dormibacteria bacterium]